MVSFSGEQAPWNSSEAFLQRVEGFWQKAGEAKVMGDAVGYFRCLEIVYLSTNDFFDAEEKEECKGLIVKIERLLESNYGRGTAAAQIRSASMWVGENECDKLYDLLAKLLFKYDLTYLKKKKPKSWDELVDEDFQ